METYWSIKAMEEDSQEYVGCSYYSKNGERFLKTLFPHKFKVIWGHSRQTLLNFHRIHLGFTCDGIMVDGGHDYSSSRSDLQLFLLMVRCGSKIAIDDIEKPELKSAWLEPQRTRRTVHHSCHSSTDADAKRKWCFAKSVESCKTRRNIAPKLP